MTTIPQKRKKPGRPATSSQNSVQSLTRALSILEVLSQHETGLILADVAEFSGIAPSTAHRLLTTLSQNGFVENDERTGFWSVGVKSFTIGNAYLKKRNFVVQARPFMDELMNLTGETCNLAVLDQTNVVFVSQVECQETMRMVVRLGSRGPLHATGVGKAMLSRLAEHKVRSLLDEAGLEKLTPNTISTPGAFLKELDKVRRQGFAIDNEEQKEGLTCFAANIYDEYTQVLAAVSISGPSVRLGPERFDEVSSQVKAVAGQITEVIGGQLPRK